MKRSIKIIMLSTLILIFAIVFGGTAYAIWVQNAGDAKFLRYDIIDENPSIKYQIYVPVNASGVRVGGTLNVTGRNYTLTNPLDIGSVAGYALVGWDGGTSVTRLELPSTYTMKINGASRAYPAVAVLVDSQFEDYLFADNVIITEIEIPVNITHIDRGAFSYMPELNHLIFKGTGSINIGDFAFASCPKLNTINRGTRTIVGNESLIFFRN